MAEAKDRVGRERVSRPFGDEQFDASESRRAVAGPFVQIDAAPQRIAVGLVIGHGLAV
ncbi:MAG: hypothetical protein QM754_20925 [Tepidisphaeraceae bacterium]